MLRLLLLLLLFALPVQAERIVADLSQSRVGISATFDGSEILVFGAVSREAPMPADGPLQIIVTVEGPPKTEIVRRKDKKLGIWVNSESARIENVPSFYAIATTAPLAESLKDSEDLMRKVSIRRAIDSVGNQLDLGGSTEFADALMRIRTENGLYSVREGAVKFMSDTLFRTSIDLPSNLTAGEYTARILITRNMNVVDVFETTLDVRKVGLERWLYTLAHDKPLYYGLMSLLIAIVAGWTASAVFSYFKS